MSRSIFARLSQRYGRPIDATTRRGFLKATLAATGGIMLSKMPGCSAPQSPSSQPRADAKAIVILGAGFAGLACGHELLAAGYRVTILEPRSRLGGRVISATNFVAGKNVEMGGELVGSNHPMWVAYAEQFKLEFIDVTEDENLEMPITLGGKTLDEKEAEKMWEEMDAAFATLTEASAAIDANQPWKSANAETLDKMTMADWWKKIEGAELNRKAIWVQLASDNAVELEKQSYLGLLAGIKGGQGEKYWTESEVYRCKGGNQQLATKLADAIGKANILLKRSATAVKETAKGVSITCSDGSVIEADEVVLAAPPSVWHKIAFEPGLPDSIKPQMGVAVKHLSALKTRFWKAKEQSPDSLSDGDISQTWEGTDNQPGDNGAALVAFSGGAAAERIRARQGAARTDAYEKQLEERYPGYGRQLVQATLMDWPSDPWTMAGYSFPAPGEVTRCGPTLHKGHGKIHFAGEHTCFKFVGYMEGGLSSGAELAKRIAVRDGVVKA